MTRERRSDNEQKSATAARELVRSALDGRITLGRVLDAGCGTGTVLAESDGYAMSLAGADIGEAFVAQARSRVAAADLRVASVEGGLPFGDRSFDTIFFCDVIEHVRAPLTALEEICRVAAPGGTIVVTTPNAGSIVRRLTGARWYALADPTHRYFFDGFGLGHLLSVAGLGSIRVRARSFTNSPPVNLLLDTMRSGGTLLALAKRSASDSR